MKFNFKNLKTTCIIFCISMVFSNGIHSQELVSIADYPLIDDLIDDTQTQFDAYVYGDPAPEPPGNDVEMCQDGVWSNENGNVTTQSLITPILKGFDLDNFEVEIEFKPTAFSLPDDVSPFKAIIMGGRLARWIGIILENTGRIGFKYNNFNTNITWTDKVLTLDQEYHHGKITYNHGQTQMFIDDELLFSQELPELVDFMRDHEFITVDYSTGSPFYGCVRNLKVKSTTLVFKSDFE